MKEIGNRILANLHFFILIYGMYGFYEQYQAHEAQVLEISSQLPSLEEQIAKNEKKLKEIDEFKKKTEEYKVRVEEVAKNIESVQKQLPAETNDSQILTYFSSEMGNLNMKDPILTPGKEEPSTYFIAKEYSLKATGTFLQFLIFFERLGSADRIYNVKTIKIASGVTGVKGRFQAVQGETVIQAYRYNPNFKVDRGFDKIEAPTKP